MDPEYEIEIAPTGYESLRAIKDKKVRQEIARSIDALAHQPEAKGKALLSPLEGVRSLCAVRSRYRVLYQVDTDNATVSVLLVGPRKPGREGDVYDLAQKLLRTLGGQETEETRS